MTPNNWTLNAYAVGAWTNLIPSAATPLILKSLIIAVGSSTAHVKIQLANSVGSRSILIPNSTLAINTGYSIDLGALTMVAGDILQVQSDVAGVQFSAFGAT